MNRVFKLARALRRRFDQGQSAANPVFLSCPRKRASSNHRAAW